MKLQNLKAELENTISAELHKVECAIAMLTLGRSVYELSNRQRREYRDLIMYRDCYAFDLTTVKSWNIDSFRSELIANNSAVYSWLGWK